MRSPSVEILEDFFTGNEDASMEIEESNLTDEDKEDPFLKFIEHAKSVLSTEEGDPYQDAVSCPSWSWIANRILRTCAAYSSGVTPAILLSELAMSWSEQSRIRAPKKHSLDITISRKKRREKSPNTVTIDSVYEKKFLSLNSVIEAVIVDAFTLTGTDIHMLCLGDICSSNTIDLYLHRRFYNIADPCNGILKKGREVLLTGCRLRVTAGNSRRIRLLPTDNFVILLDEDEDDDAMLLGAQFCSDSFSSISLDDVAVGASYSLYARIENIGALEEIHAKSGGLQRKQITLVDNDGARLKFLLWGAQVLIANLLSVGSILALDCPFVASAKDSSLEACDEICLEYGSVTKLYLVPPTPHKEQVSVALTQNQCQGSRLLRATNPSQGHMVSQVELPCDSHGSIDFSNYPFRFYVADLHDKMTGVSLYGAVIDIRPSQGMLSIRIEDESGAAWAKLHLTGHWSLGRLDTGHTIFISGLSTSLAPDKSIQLSWHEDNPGSSFFNLSCLPVLLNSSCLHRLSRLCDLSTSTIDTMVCRVWVDQTENFHVEMRFMHTPCGHLLDTFSGPNLECRFCQRICGAEIQRAFSVRMTIADGTSKVLVRCIGQTAAEMLQISPEEFHALSEEEQIIYPSSLESENYTVAIVNCRREFPGKNFEQCHDDCIEWEVTSAIKS